MSSKSRKKKADSASDAKSNVIPISALRKNIKNKMKFRQVAVRVSEAEFQELIRRANDGGFTSLSSFIRSFIFVAAAPEKIAEK